MRRAYIDLGIFPIDIEQGKAGLFYITSPLVPGLLVTGRTENEALDSVQGALNDLTEAITLFKAEERS
jgi:predicted RNase H-like HicB family nuclease